jgi:hypothetical protein
MLITIQKEINIIQGGDTDNYYTRDTEEFFYRQCNEINKSICDYGFMISIYTAARKVRISAGKVSKNVVTIDNRNNVIYNIKNLLSKERYTEGILQAIALIQSYSSININNNNYNPNYQPNIQPQPQPHPPKNDIGSSNFWIILIFIICPVICICIYCMVKNRPQEHQDTAEDIHNHICKLDHLIKDIRNNSPPIKSINKCLICMQKIHLSVNFNGINNFSTTNNDYYNNQNYVNNNLIINDPNHTRFACGHLYHNFCLNECKLGACIMCSGNVHASMVIPNTHDHHVVDENSVRSFIGQLHLIYDRRCLEDYSRTYPNEFDSFNTTLALGLVGVWGITAVATTAIMMNDINHTGYYNDSNYYSSNTYNNYQGGAGGFDDNPDTAEGDY